MLYDISLTIENDFAAPVSRSRNLVRVLPTSLQGMQVLHQGSVEISPPPTQRGDRVDFFGNAVTDARHAAPVDKLSVTLRARVERTASSVLMDLSAPYDALASELGAWRNLGPGSPLHFRAASPRVALSDTLSGFGREALAPGMSCFAVVQALGKRLHDEMEFDATATDVTTPPEEAFGQRRGVCQDFTHIMIAALRGIGIPAAYVSGFLRTLPPPGQPKLSGADAMHAWVRAWCGGQMGWVEYDPTNDTVAGPDHITVGYGRDYSDVAPLRGVSRGWGEQSARHAVDVVEVAA